MHFCQDELFAILSVLPWLTVGIRWLQVRLFRKVAPLPVPQAGSPYRSACPCPGHLPKHVSKPSRSNLTPLILPIPPREA